MATPTPPLPEGALLKLRAKHAQAVAIEPLRPAERELLKLYRGLPPRRAALVLSLARYLASGKKAQEPPDKT